MRLPPPKPNAAACSSRPPAPCARELAASGAAKVARIPPQAWGNPSHHTRSSVDPDAMMAPPPDSPITNHGPRPMLPPEEVQERCRGAGSYAPRPGRGAASPLATTTPDAGGRPGSERHMDHEPLARVGGFDHAPRAQLGRHRLSQRTWNPRRCATVISAWRQHARRGAHRSRSSLHLSPVGEDPPRRTSS